MVYLILALYILDKGFTSVLPIIEFKWDFGLLTSLSLMRTGSSLSELFTTYCSTGSSLPLLWLFPMYADCPTPDHQETKEQQPTVTREIICHQTDHTNLHCHIIPVSTRASPIQNQTLISGAIMFWTLLSLECADSVDVAPFCTVPAMFVLLNLWDRGSSYWFFCCIAKIGPFWEEDISWKKMGKKIVMWF